MEHNGQRCYRSDMFRITPVKTPEYKLLKARQACKMQEAAQTSQQITGYAQCYNRVVLKPRQKERPTIPCQQGEGKLHLQRRQQAAWDNLAALREEQDTAANLRERQSFAKYGAKTLADLKRQKQEREADRSLARYLLNAARQTQVQEKRQRQEAERQRELNYHRAREADRMLFQQEQKLKAAKAKQDSISRRDLNLSMAAAQRVRLQAEKRDHRDAANCCSVFPQTIKAQRGRKLQICQTLDTLAPSKREHQNAETLTYGESNYVSAGCGEPKYRLPEQPHRGRRLRPVQIPIKREPDSTFYMQLPFPNVEQAFSHSLEGSNYISAGTGEPKYRLPFHPRPPPTRRR